MIPLLLNIEFDCIMPFVLVQFTIYPSIKTTMQTQLQALGAFLKARRLSLSPLEVGVSTVVRQRRTPGLRREEVAMLAHIGTTWYTWLEQGRAKGVSTQALRGLARALRLSPAEAAYMYKLAGAAVPPVPSEKNDYLSVLQQIVDGQSWPAYIIDHQWNLLYWNSKTADLYGDFAKLSPKDRNIMRFLLLNPTQKERLVDWEQEAQNTIALFRNASMYYAQEEWYATLIADLKQNCTPFEKWWNAHAVSDTHAGKKKVRYRGGVLELNTTVMNSRTSPGLQLHIQTPANKASEKLLLTD